MKTVNGVPIETLSRDLIEANMMEVEVGTNGFFGGDQGHGSRTYFRLKNLGGTNMEVLTKPSDESENAVDEVVIMLGGDSELLTFMDALSFALKVLDLQIGD